jgi:hypothetical protein
VPVTGYLIARNGTAAGAGGQAARRLLDNGEPRWLGLRRLGAHEPGRRLGLRRLGADELGPLAVVHRHCRP